jgi:hypothetical protein
MREQRGFQFAELCFDPDVFLAGVSAFNLG